MGNDGPFNIRDIQKLPIPEVYKTLETGSAGLTKSGVESRLKRFGKNLLREKPGKPLISKFMANFTHLMAILLWVGGIVGFMAKMPELGIAIWMVNLINGLFGFWQEFRAEKATEALKKLLPAYARVIRDGEEQRILAEELVPGDIILLSEGDKISADGRLVDDSYLEINQSTLTGESHPVHKARHEVLRDDLSKPEQPNMVFAGTSVASGTGKAVVISTGMETEFGRIADLTQTIEDAPSPLQEEMGRITKTVSVLAVSIGVFFFFAAVFMAGADLAESFIFAMGMIVAFIPEGLLPTVTLSLAMGVQRMAKRGALIKRLSAVETLGCTTVICTDKTGTLTQNEITVSEIWMPDRQFNVTGLGYSPEGQIVGKDRQASTEDPNLRQFLAVVSLCNNARLIPPDDESPNWTILGDPTEAALLVLARKGGLDPEEEARRTPRLRELPFESGRKRMSTIHQIVASNTGKEHVAYVKGAPKEILELCAAIRQNGRDQPLGDDVRAEIMEANDRYARNGLRVLAVALRRLPKEANLPSSLRAYTPELIERDLTFLGMVAMADPPRPEVAEAVEKCKRAGIRIIMITGDYGLTAESIARRIGIVGNARPRIITGVELRQMRQSDLEEALRGEVIFARVAPEQKLQVVSALQAMGHVVAVTGDGVNDSPALKKADIGVAMGISGTDAAKGAADMILTDDNFSSIVNAVEEGRAVYNNIRKFTVYIFNSNVAEAVPFILFLFSRGRIPLPLTIMQVLAIDLGTDMVPAVALGAELPEEGIMDVPPRSQKEPLLNRRLLARAMLWYGLLESAIATFAYFLFNWTYGWPDNPLADAGIVYRMATTTTLAAIVLAQVGAVFACRSERASIFKVGLLTNRLILAGVAVELSLLCLLVYSPFLQTLFNTAPIGLREWGFLMLIPGAVLLLDETRKWILRRSSDKGAAV